MDIAQPQIFPYGRLRVAQTTNELKATRDYWPVQRCRHWIQMLRLSTPRQLSERELAVLRKSLECNGKSSLLAFAIERLANLRVIGGCACGCESVDFAEHDPTHPARPIADAVGSTAAGGEVGIIIWGTDDAVTGIEVYDLGAGDGDIKLPIESSIRIFPRQ